MPSYGETRNGTCTWCGKQMVQVWRRYNFGHPLLVSILTDEGYWSEENCTCGSLQAIVGDHNNMKHVGRFERTVHRKKTP